ncbi:serine/threonine protein kinase [Paenibacillus spongiae]|uniref:Serine/threonine protein kinase n=1 Tax=Paenibacillus spongiae TaxID=2909671 RepID=A0ABY5S7S3_9BACL|nr:serine/threonine protein kinase [Paenibacillus spongiae]UVI29981.1 serine/threonine protein kinase [Paenibacillus spongiae]
MTEGAKSDVINPNQIREFASWVEQSLLPELVLESVHDGEPIIVRRYPEQWSKLGAGNYAGVFAHPLADDLVVKVYTPGRGGFEDEVEVYGRLGEHAAYSQCYDANETGGFRYLILKRLRGKTLYQCILEGIPIPARAIEDVDEALDYARSRGLRPHDVHGKNIMINEGRGFVVDVSDFLKQDACTMWDDMKKAYKHLYLPYLSKRPVPIPEWIMDGVRKGYRLFKS